MLDKAFTILICLAALSFCYYLLERGDANLMSRIKDFFKR
jgi:hypothetical protein